MGGVNPHPVRDRKQWGNALGFLFWMVNSRQHVMWFSEVPVATLSFSNDLDFCFLFYPLSLFWALSLLFPGITSYINTQVLVSSSAFKGFQVKTLTLFI